MNKTSVLFQISPYSPPGSPKPEPPIDLQGTIKRLALTIRLSRSKVYFLLPGSCVQIKKTFLRQYPFIAKGICKNTGHASSGTTTLSPGKPLMGQSAIGAIGLHTQGPISLGK